MKTRLLALCPVLLLLPLERVAGDATLAQPPQRSVWIPAKLHGEWRAVALDFCGMHPPRKLIEAYRVSIAGESIRMDSLAHDPKLNAFHHGAEQIAFSYKLSFAGHPAGIDLIYTHGKEQQRMLGIWSWEDGRLKLCWYFSGKQRPASFQLDAASKGMMMVLEPMGKEP